MNVQQWLAGSGLTQVPAAKLLGVTQARVSDPNRGKIDTFSLDLLGVGKAHHLPALRTGLADFPHPALQLGVSTTGVHKRLSGFV